MYYKYYAPLILSVLMVQANADEYRGKIGAYPIHLSTFDNDSYAVYIYDTQGTPIVIASDGRTKNEKILYEGLDFKHPNTTARAKLTFTQKLGQSNQLTGSWEDLKTHKQLPIQLTRYNESAGALQSSTFKSAYIRKSCSLPEDKFVRLFSKKTNLLTQTIKVNGLCSFDEVRVGDYNFDGYEDFSVFNESFSGPNTNRNYYLFNPKKRQYELSDDLTDVTLSFDAKTKTVTSTNQCCAGSQVLEIQSKWVGHHLKPIAKKCYKYDEKLDKLHRVVDNACD